MNRTKFGPGQVVATPGCLAALAEAGQQPHEFLARHLAGDWGDVDAEDAALNNAALVDGGRLLSAYRLKTGIELWVVTEAAGDDGRRASTCCLLPAEY